MFIQFYYVQAILCLTRKCFLLLASLKLLEMQSTKQF